MKELESPVDRFFLTARWWLPVVAAATLLFGIGSGSLDNWDEATYAQVSKEMLRSSAPMTPTSGGVPWHHKPPLALWGTMVAYSIAGVSEGSARLVSVLSGILSVLAMPWLARIFVPREDRLRFSGVLSALLLLSTPHFLILSKMGMLDVPLLLAGMLCIGSYRSLLLRRPHPPPRVVGAVVRR